MVIQFPERKFPGKGSMSSQAFSAKGAPPVVIPLSRRLGPWSLASSCLSLLSRPFAPVGEYIQAHYFHMGSHFHCANDDPTQPKDRA